MADITDYNNLPLKTLKDSVRLYRFDPSSIQRSILDYLQAVTLDQIDIVDPTNPFIFLLEASAVNTAAAIEEDFINTRKLYPRLAVTEEDLYVHMSDIDYLNRFATPVRTKITMLFEWQRAQHFMVDSPDEDCMKFVIPRDTEITINSVVFTLQYPVQVKKFYNNVVQVSYDTAISSDLLSLTTNIIEASIRTNPDGTIWLGFDVEAIQTKIQSEYFTVEASQYFSKTMAFNDQFHYAKVYYRNDNTQGQWKAIRTTHSDQVFDSSVPTAVLNVAGQQLKVFIPPVYVDSGIIQGNLRIDVYTTKGAVNINMRNFSMSAYETNFRAIDEERDITDYTNALADIPFIVYSDKNVVGGTNSVGFSKLREQVIYNTVGMKNLPITNIQLEHYLSNYDFEIVRNVDNITNRIFTAVRDLPKPSNTSLVTAANLSSLTVAFTMDHLRNLDEVYYNGDRATIAPTTLFKNNNGVVEIFDKNRVDALMSLVNSSIAQTVSEAEFLYTPFYYVLDNSLTEFEVRAYNLDDPLAYNFGFLYQNTSTTLAVNTSNYSLLKTTKGYKLIVQANISNSYYQLQDAHKQAQLCFKPPGEKDYAYVNASSILPVSAEQSIFTFDIETNYDIDTDNYLYLTNFRMYSKEALKVRCPLTMNFKILYSTGSKPDGFTGSYLDNMVGKFLLTQNSVGLSLENLTLKLGESLKNLWTRSRTVAAGAQFETYMTDVPLVYDEDTYIVDPDTGLNFTVDTSGDITYTYEHRKGDVVRDELGDVIYKHRKGDVVLDDKGNPVGISDLYSMRYVDMVFVDGMYYFSQNPNHISYRTEIRGTIVGWVTQALASIQDLLLEQTKIYFYPRKSIGSTKIKIQDDTETNISAMQSFTVDIYVTSKVYADTRTREQLRVKTVTVLDSMVRMTKIAISDIVSTLKTTYGTDCLGVRVSGLGGDRNLEVLALASDDQRLTLKKILMVSEDGVLTVQEDVTVNFIEMAIS